MIKALNELYKKHSGGREIYDPPIRRNIKLAECPSFGQTIFQYEPHCAGARDYERLAEAVCGVSKPVVAALERVIEPVIPQVPLDVTEVPTPQIHTVAESAESVSESGA